MKRSKEPRTKSQDRLPASLKSQSRSRFVLVLGSLFLALATASAQAVYEHREGYTAQLVQVPVSHADTATGYLLIPDSIRKAPAALVLHDHGAHFSIGTEKMVCPIRPAEADSAD